jgi:hypothetical protein
MVALAAVAAGVYELLQMIPVVRDAGWLVDAGFSMVATLLAVFIFPMLLPVILFFFSSSVVENVERAEYPGVPEPVPPYWPSLMQDALFVGKTLLLNLLVLPLYLVPVVNLFVYYVLNGYLLSSEMYSLVAGRHLMREQAVALKRIYGRRFFIAGVCFAFAMTLPVVNLVAPLWGIALMVHLFHGTKPVYKALEGKTA